MWNLRSGYSVNKRGEDKRVAGLASNVKRNIFNICRRDTLDLFNCQEEPGKLEKPSIREGNSGLSGSFFMLF